MADELVREMPGVQVANWNGPRQTVVAGPAEAVDRLVALAAARGIVARRLPVASAFHTPMVAGAREPFARLAADRLRRSPDRAVYSNVDAAPYPADPAAMAARLGEHLARPVRFDAMVDAMYRDGARVFVEVGPGSILSPMVESILEGRPHLSLSCDATPTPGLAAFLRQVARLVVAGLPLSLDRLTAGRVDRCLDLDRLPPGEMGEVPSASTWLVNGSRSRPFAGPEPARLGTAPALPVAAPAPSVNAAKPAPPAPPNTNADAPARLNGHSNGKPGPHMTTQIPSRPKEPAALTPTQPQGDPVIESFQKTMRMFLEVQKATMLAYLSGRGASGVPAPHAPVNMTARAAETHGNGTPYRNGDATCTPGRSDSERRDASIRRPAELDGPYQRERPGHLVVGVAARIPGGCPQYDRTRRSTRAERDARR